MLSSTGVIPAVLETGGLGRPSRVGRIRGRRTLYWLTTGGCRGEVKGRPCGEVCRVDEGTGKGVGVGGEDSRNSEFGSEKRGEFDT